MKNILLVENTNHIGSLMPFLSGEGYRVQRVDRIADAQRAIKSSPALVILDWNLVDGSGIDFLKDLRTHGVETPVVMVSPRSDAAERVMGFEAGANDCVSRPCEPRELVARVRAQLRHTGAEATPDVVEGAGIELNSSTREVRYLGAVVKLRRLEFDLLKLFLQHPNRVFTRDELLNLVWGYDRYPTTRTIDTHMLALRQKIAPHLFETLRGVGYRFCPESQEAMAA